MQMGRHLRGGVLFLVILDDDLRAGPPFPICANRSAYRHHLDVVIRVEVPDQLRIVVCRNTVAAPVRQVFVEPGQTLMLPLGKFVLGIALEGAALQRRVGAVQEHEVPLPCRLDRVLEVAAEDFHALQILGQCPDILRGDGITGGLVVPGNIEGPLEFTR